MATITYVSQCTADSGNVFVFVVLVITLSFNPDGETLASGGADCTIRIWNYCAGELLQTLEHLGPVKSVAFSPDGKTLIGGSSDATVKIWRVPA